MEVLELSLGLLLEHAVFVTMLLGLPIISLIDLGKKRRNGTPLAVWVLVICAIPVLGSVSYWMIKPTVESRI